MQNLKNTFILACGMFFVLSCFDPGMGFLDAQAELTILTFIIPIFFTLIYLGMKMTSNTTIKLLVYGVPMAAIVATMLCRLSAFGGPGSVLLVTLHIYGKFTLFYGHSQPFEELGDTPEFELIKHVKSDTDDSSSHSGSGDNKRNHQNRELKLTVEEDAVTRELVVPETSERKNPQKLHHRRIAAVDSRTLPSPVCSNADISSPIPKSTSMISPTVSNIKQSLNKNARTLVHNIVEVLPSSLEGTNSVFVYKGLVNLMIALIIICGVFVTLFEVYRDICLCHLLFNILHCLSIHILTILPLLLSITAHSFHPFFSSIADFESYTREQTVVYKCCYP